MDDLADGLLHLLSLVDPPDVVNVGTGVDVSIHELADLIAEVVGYGGEITTDPSKPDGTPVKRTDMSLMHSTGWNARIDLRTGIEQTYQNYLAEVETGAVRVS